MFPVFNAANCIVDFGGWLCGNGGLWCGNGELVVDCGGLVVWLRGFRVWFLYDLVADAAFGNL